MRNFFTKMIEVLASIFRAVSPVIFAIQATVGLLALPFYIPLMGVIGLLFWFAFIGGPVQLAVAVMVFFALTLAVVAASQIKSRWVAIAVATFAVACQLRLVHEIVHEALPQQSMGVIDFVRFFISVALIGAQINFWWLLRHLNEIFAWVQKAWAWVRNLFTRRPPAPPAPPTSPALMGGGHIP